MGVEGNYILNVYCDCRWCRNAKTMPHQFIGQTEQDCMSQARKLGYRFKSAVDGVPEHGTGAVKCPRCVKEGWEIKLKPFKTEKEGSDE